MKPFEIVGSIQWATDVDEATRRQVEDAIHRLAGGNRPTFNEMTVHRRLEAFVASCGTANRAAEALGISKSFMHDIRAGHRPVPDDILAQLGIERVRSKILYREL